jgi:hypothetical protein
MTSLNSFLDLKNFRTFGDFLIPPTCVFLEDSEGDDFKPIPNSSPSGKRVDFDDSFPLSTKKVS